VKINGGLKAEVVKINGGLNLRRPPIIIPLPSSSLFKVQTQTSVARFFEFFKNRPFRFSKRFRIKESTVPVLWGKNIQNPGIVGSSCLKNLWVSFPHSKNRLTRVRTRSSSKFPVLLGKWKNTQSSTKCVRNN